MTRAEERPFLKRGKRGASIHRTEEKTPERATYLLFMGLTWWFKFLILAICTEKGVESYYESFLY